MYLNSHITYLMVVNHGIRTKLEQAKIKSLEAKMILDGNPIPMPASPVSQHHRFIRRR